MLSIQYNYSTSHLHRRLGENQRAASKAMEKISSGYRINTASDGPAELTMSEKLRAQIAGLEKAMQNANNSYNVMSTAEGGLGMAASLLRKMKGLAIRAANTGVRSKDTIAADQAELDSALQALEKIFNTTSIGGGKLMEKVLSNAGLSGVDASALQPANIVATPESYARDRGKNAEIVDGELVLNADGLSTLGKTLVKDGRLANCDTTFVLSGLAGDPEETTELVFAEGKELSEVLAGLRALGLPAGLDPATDALALPQTRTGENANLVAMPAGMLAQLHNLPDAEAEGLLEDYLNDFVASNQNGELLKLSDAERELLGLANKLKDGNLTNIGGIQIASGRDENGDATYQTLSLNDLFSGGAASLLRDPETAMKILDQALKDVLQTQAQIGASMAMMQYGQGDLEALARSESSLRDADIATEATELARSQINSQVCINLLAQVQKQYKESIINLLA